MELTTAQQISVRTSAMMAQAYVWGRQDAGEGELDSQRAFLFGEAYAEHDARYLTGEIGIKNNLRRAWEQWTTFDKIEG